MKIGVFYYTQSGQALNVAKSICSPISDNTENQVIYKQIIPLQHYPFPWSKNEFFNAFPETRLGLPPSGIKDMTFDDVENADLVIIVGQSWFLSPSLPIQSFFRDKQVTEFLKDKNIIFVNSCRNMWLMTSRAIKNYIQNAHANLVGHIVLQDEAPNLISVITIIRWLIFGKKESTLLLPRAGISDHNIEGAHRFGEIIYDTIKNNKIEHMQRELLSAGAINYKPSVLFQEKVGHRMFGFWAKFVRSKGEFGNKRRRFRQDLFMIYLFTILFVISPFGVLFFYLTYPLRHIAKNKQEDCSV